MPEARSDQLPETRVVNLRRAQFDVYIGRPSKWGNPYRVGRHGSHQEVVDLYRRFLYSKPQLMAEARAELAGKVLGCYCVPNPCHGDVLAEVANNGG